MKRIVVGLLGAIGIIAALTLLGCGIIDDGKFKPEVQEIAWEPFPTPEIRIVEVPVEKIVEVEKIIVMEPTPIPESEFHCFTGKVEMVAPSQANGGFMISIVGEQLLCARDWKMSNIYGPVGSLEANPDRPLTFNDLQKMVEKQKKTHEQKAEDMH